MRSHNPAPTPSNGSWEVGVVVMGGWVVMITHTLMRITPTLLPMTVAVAVESTQREQIPFIPDHPSTSRTGRCPTQHHSQTAGYPAVMIILTVYSSSTSSTSAMVLEGVLLSLLVGAQFPFPNNEV